MLLTWFLTRVADCICAVYYAITLLKICWLFNLCWFLFHHFFELCWLLHSCFFIPSLIWTRFDYCICDVFYSITFFEHVTFLTHVDYCLCVLCWFHHSFEPCWLLHTWFFIPSLYLTLVDYNGLYEKSQPRNKRAICLCLCTRLLSILSAPLFYRKRGTVGGYLHRSACLLPYIFCPV